MTGRNFMQRRTKYTDEPLGPLEVTEDFLPSPAELRRRIQHNSVKITLALSQRSVDFFKAEAARGDTSYQRMIRCLLDEYVARQTRPKAPAKQTGRAAGTRSNKALR